VQVKPDGIARQGTGRRARTVLRAGIALAAFLVVLLFAQYALATVFNTYDDEGYMLLSLDHYLQRSHLYTETFSQYGPFYFYVQTAFFRLLQLPVSHDSGRLVALICWLLSAVSGGYFVYRVSNNMVLASAAMLACGQLAIVLANEPGHPQQVILPIFMVACCASVLRGRGRSGLLLLGALGAALLFTKINVGVYYLVALAHVLVCSFPSSRLRTAGVALLCAYAVGCPLLLMHRDIVDPYPWARGYCLLAMLYGVSVFLAGSFTMPPAPRPMRRIGYAAAGAFSVAMLIVAGTMLQGMSLATLMEGVLWAPLRHPGVFFVPYLVRMREVFGAVLVTACIAALYWYRDRAWARADWIGAVRCAVGLCVIYMLAVRRENLAWALQFLPLGLLPISGQEWRPSDFFPRLFITSLAATQFLQPYPVAGSQLGIAAAPALLWAFICVYDGADGLFSLARRATDLFWGAFPRVSALGGLVAGAFVIAMFPTGSWSQPYPYPSSHLRGSASLHLPPDLEDLYLFLANSARVNCDVLFTMPGMGSLNYWSGVPTPNGWNLTAWMRGFSPDRQQRILEILQANPRGCSVVQAGLVRFWQVPPEELEGLPLARYIMHNMRPVAARDGFEIRVHPQRSSPWVDVPADPFPEPR
jgi:hypothetical protein